MLQLGYHPATYLRQGRDADAALLDISRTGWDGFEWSPVGLEPQYADPAPFAARLAELDLVISGIYCSCGFRDAAEIAAWHDRVDTTIAFAQAVGAQVVMLDGGSLDLPQTASTIDRIAELANAVARRVTDAGLVCTWHQHWGTLFQYPDDFDALMSATDPSLLRSTPDTAQMALGGFDIPATFERYAARMDYVHFKDLDDDRRFIELGRGRVAFEPLVEILAAAGFDGWIVVDLDYTSLEPEESSRINLAYLRSELGLRGRREP